MVYLQFLFYFQMFFPCTLLVSGYLPADNNITTLSLIFWCGTLEGNTISINHQDKRHRAVVISGSGSEKQSADINSKMCCWSYKHLIIEANEIFLIRSLGGPLVFSVNKRKRGILRSQACYFLLFLNLLLCHYLVSHCKVPLASYSMCQVVLKPTDTCHSAPVSSAVICLKHSSQFFIGLPENNCFEFSGRFFYWKKTPPLF